ncbi:hypothetical protein CGLAMM_01805 [Acetobacteraceae bacterium EV16G]|uniref:Uncharacterized protein n=1 Tax=Sorlinia euscelidii TaxID=3081148 RepID=A0ABU7U513_9PROT
MNWAGSWTKKIPLANQRDFFRETLARLSNHER